MGINIIIVWISFLFCLGLAAGGILVLFKNRMFRQFPSFKFLQYAIILLYTFGFYSLWSQIFFELFFNPEQNEDLKSLSDFVTIMGSPFLLAGVVMFCLWSYNLLKQVPKAIFLICTFSIPPLLIGLFLLFKGSEFVENVYQMYAFLAIAFVTGNSILLIFSELKFVARQAKIILLLIIFSIGLIHVPFLFPINWSQIFEVSFIFLFFLTITSLEVYFLYNAAWNVNTINSVPAGEEISFDSFIRKYGITTRELEIIKELYAGKTNKEIAETLFITLQTVKDHNHRIFQKTQVKSRNQLASLLRNYDHNL